VKSPVVSSQLVAKVWTSYVVSNTTLCGVPSSDGAERLNEGHVE
jgi:hypothetical protein